MSRRSTCTAVSLLAAVVLVAGAARGNDPVLTASVDWMFLQRGRLDATRVFTTNAGANIFNASQFGFDFQSGVDINLRYRLSPSVTLEGRYLWVDAWQDAVGPFPLTAGDQAGTTPLADVGNETDWVLYETRRTGSSTIRGSSRSRSTFAGPSPAGWTWTFWPASAM